MDKSTATAAPSGSKILSNVRDELLAEARQSPGLLADLANLERYVAETYSARSFIELLQNADDAQAQRFAMMRSGEWLLCANDGHAFSRQDFYSLCRSASSAKRRGQTIGYRGIGFKSVVGVATDVHLFSNDLQATFSRALTNSSLGSDTPAPLIRVPHALALDPTDSVLAEVKLLQRSGLTTVFVLGGLDSDRVQDEFDQFDVDYLLFLRHVREAVLTNSGSRTYTCERESTTTDIREITVAGPDRYSAWRIHHVGECDLAFSLDNGEPVALTSATAIAHAFLPTLDSTGFGIRINADFSTDPSRTRVVFDDTTFLRMDEAAGAIAQLITQATLAGESGAKVRRALTPTVELATLSLQKRSFRTELITRVKTRLAALKDQIMLAPIWLNKGDVAKMAAHLKRSVLPQGDGIDAAQTTFLRYIGVQVISLKTVAAAAKHMAPSIEGCAELLTQTARDVTSGVSMRELIDQPIWWSESQREPVELAKIVNAKVALTAAFVSAVGGAGLSLNELARLLSSAGVTPVAIACLLPFLAQNTTGTPQTFASATPATQQPDSSSRDIDLFLSNEHGQLKSLTSTAPITSQSLPAWRGAEQYVAQVLQEHGYSVEDRSRQNLGYDLYAEKGNDKRYFEVKLLDYAGQPFIITTNEEAVARECGDRYVIALTLRSSDSVHVQFVRNPVRNMRFVRQCRQWVWECSDYAFSSEHALK